MSDGLSGFYPDLAASDFEAPLAVFHPRFSTNTTPTWERAQPFRYLCHNGEINTLRGNEHRMAARGRLGTEEAGLGPEELFSPGARPGGLRLRQARLRRRAARRGGRDIRHAVAMLVPEAWEGSRDLDPEVRGFFRYHACLIEPWDGPAGLIFTDGLRVGAALDRNGLRPLRFQVCDDGFVVCASEVGAVPIAGHGKVRRGRLGPGQMLFVDPDARAGFLTDAAIKRALARRAPYARWAADGLRRFPIGTPQVGAGRRGRDHPHPGRLRLHQGGAGHGAQAHGHRRQGADLLDGRRHALRRPGRAAPARPPLPQAALRPGHQPAHRPPPGAAGDEPAHVLGPRQPILSERPEAARLLELPTFFLYPTPSTTCSTPTGRRSRRCGSTPPSRRPTARPASGRRSTGWPTRPRRPCGEARPSSSWPTPASDPSGRRCRRCWPPAPSTTG